MHDLKKSQMKNIVKFLKALDPDRIINISIQSDTDEESVGMGSVTIIFTDAGERAEDEVKYIQ